MYVRKFQEQSSKELKKVKWSTHLPKPVVESIFNTEILDSDYMLCPMYSDGAVQIGITGTVGTKETFIQGMARELAEEAGLLPKSIKNLRRVGNLYQGHKHTLSYIAYIGVLKPVQKFEHDREVEGTGKDDPNKKVSCIVYGEKSHMLRFLNKAEIYRFYSVDDIVGLAAIPVSKIRSKIMLV